MFLLTCLRDAARHPSGGGGATGRQKNPRVLYTDPSWSDFYVKIKSNKRKEAFSFTTSNQIKSNVFLQKITLRVSYQ